MTRKKSSVAGPPDVAQIVAKMRSDRAKGRGQRSPLYLWLRQNHARLVEEFAANAPSWPGLASALGDSGIFNGEGKPPTPEGARTVWYRVRREVAGTRKPVADKSLLKPEETVSPVLSATQPARSNGEVDAPRRFGTVKLRGPVPSSPTPETAVTKPDADAASVDVDHVLAKFMPSAAKRE